jgi:Transposase DDE domain
MVANGSRGGYRHLLDGFWDEARSFGASLPTPEPVSAPAFCKARRKLPPEVTRTLLHRAADAFEQRFGSRLRWCGRRVFGVDGSRCNVRRSAELAERFTVPFGAHCPQILVTTLFDLVSKVPHDVVIAPYNSSEREQLVLLLDRVRPGDVVVLDRGYPSFEVLCILADAGIDFVMRVQLGSTFPAVERFVRSRDTDARISISSSKDTPLKDRAPIEIRAIRIEQRGLGPTILLTSLKATEFGRRKIAALYHARWEIEEYYKLVKSDYLSQGQFHAKTEAGVRQEVHAVALFVAIARFFMAAAARQSKLPYDSLSPKSGALGLAAYTVRLLLGLDRRRAPLVLDQLLNRIVRTRDPKRPGRCCPRRSFRPYPKWGPRGRHGS